MAQRAVDVAAIFRLLSEQNPMHKYDAKVAPVSWNSQVFESKEKLRIGYFTSLHISPTLGDIPVMVLKAKSILESLGHTVIPFELTNADEYNRVLMSVSSADLGQHMTNALKHEEVSPCIADLYNALKTPYWQKKLLSLKIGRAHV